MYKAYLDKEEYLLYFPNSIINPDELEERIKRASRHIDSLTFNRIVEKGFENLTNFQKDIIKEVIAYQTEFECENEEMLDNVFSSYSLNGVSMTFDSSVNLYLDKGIAIKKELYSLLEQTGLTTRRI